MARAFRIDAFNQVVPSEKAKEWMDDFRKRANVLATNISVIPDCYEKDTALAKLEEVVMWANKGAAFEMKDK